MVTSARLLQLLAQHSTKKWFIEYNGFLSNHLAHGIIALSALGATGARVDRFIEVYTRQHLEPPQNQLGEGDNVRADQVKSQRIGARINYYPLLKYYEEQVELLGIEKAVATHFPIISGGMSGAAFHGLIHTGYGFSVSSPTITSEGLAYLHYSGATLSPQTPATSFETPQNEKETLQNKNKSTANTITRHQFRSMVFRELNEIRSTGKLTNLMHRHYNQNLEPRQTTLGAFQKKLLSLGKVEDVSAHVEPFLPYLEDLEPVVLVDVALCLYDLTGTENMDFFVLHLVTGAYALSKVCHVLSAEHKTKVYREYLLALFASYVARDCPEFLGTEPNESMSETWDSIAERCIVEDRDEHVYKLVQVAQEMSVLFPEETGYKSAALKTIKLPLHI